MHIAYLTDFKNDDTQCLNKTNPPRNYKYYLK